MTIVGVILALIVLVNGAFAMAFVKDLAKHRSSFMEEPGNPFVMALSSFIIFFLSTFGVSDFAIGTVLYRRLQWVEDKKLPGTLNTECVIPVAVMALAYISSIQVGLATLILCIAAQVVGAYVGPRFVVKMNVRLIKKFISAGLLIAALLILMNKFGLYPSGGEATSLMGWKLVLMTVLSFIYGALNNVGIGSYALTMATIYALGMNPGVAFPIMMGACTFSVPIGSMQFIKFDSYSRKITFFTATLGVLGVLVAVFIVKSVDVSMLQWIVAAVLIYTAFSMILELFQTEVKSPKEVFSNESNDS